LSVKHSMTIHQAITYGEKLLQENGVEQPRWNAERILILTLRQDRGKVYAELTRQLNHSEQQEFYNLIRKRAEHYPLAYIEGNQEFYGRSFIVNEEVLIPRPETEEIVRAILSLKLPKNLRVLDLGAGSGNIAATLAWEIPASFVIALELSSKAIELMRKNIPAEVSAVQGSMFTPPFLSASFDIITSNPPYVEVSSLKELPAETAWEPRLALLSENLEETYTEILDQAERLVKRKGHFVFEIGYGQVERIQKLCETRKAWELHQIRGDQRGVPRVFVLQRAV
jgi:release factor glutamine methyltransferase